jgi:hypothetical protein
MRVSVLAVTMLALTGVPAGASARPVRFHSSLMAQTDSIKPTARHHALIGAAIGAVSGAAVGLFATRDVSLGCKALYPSDCDPRRTERNIRIGVTLGTTTLGAAVGALIGRFLWK